MIRKATIDDLNQIWALRLKTTDLLKSRGIDQWQYVEPSIDQFRSDIEKQTFYVCDQGGKIVGMMFIMEEIEETYNHIDGTWHIDKPYITIHRLAVDKDYLGIGLADKLMEFSAMYALTKHVGSIRIDTHKDNHQAQRLFLKHGYQYCGIITLEEKVQGDRLRLAYDLKIGV